MSEYEKVVLLYLAHQSEMLHLIAKANSDALDVENRNRVVNGKDTHELAKDINRVASPQILNLLRGI